MAPIVTVGMPKIFHPLYGEESHICRALLENGNIAAAIAVIPNTETISMPVTDNDSIGSPKNANKKIPISPSKKQRM